MTEIWKDIKEYEGLYQVSNLGNVKRILFKNGKCEFKKEKILSIVKGKEYYFVSLSKNNIKKTILIHRLVAEAFIPNSNKLREVNHKDGNKANNCVGNLEWCSPSQNIKHAYKKGLIKRYKEKYDKMKKSVEQYSLNGILLATYESIAEASRKTNIDGANIGKSCKIKNRNAGRYKWKFIERSR